MHPSMDLDIAGRTALVAASTEGIGFACAKALASAGCHVAVNGRRKEPLEAAAEELREIAADAGADAGAGAGAGDSPDVAAVTAVQADVSDADDVQRLVQTVRRELADPDILVVNAGGPPPGGFADVTDEDWMAAVDLTLMSAVRLTRAVLPAMREQGWGRIVYVTSTSVQETIPGLVLSNSLRRAVVGMAMTLSREVAGDGVTVNCLAPGSTDTERIHDLARDRAERAGVAVEAMEELMQAEIPVGRYADPGEMGDAVAFLCSERAAYVTGHVLPVEGGRLRG